MNKTRHAAANPVGVGPLYAQILHLAGLVGVGVLGVEQDATALPQLVDSNGSEL